MKYVFLIIILIGLNSCQRKMYRLTWYSNISGDYYQGSWQKNLKSLKKTKEKLDSFSPGNSTHFIEVK